MGLKTSKAGIDLIKRFEGCVLVAYKCPANVWTIGYGHTGADVYEGLRWTQAQADNALKNDLVKYENYVNKVASDYGYIMTQSNFDALVSFTYNCGNGNLRKLTNYGKRTLESLPQYMVLYNKANGTTLRGLVNRRNAEVELFNSGANDKKEIETKAVTLDTITFGVRLNYNIRETPNGKIISNTNLLNKCKVKAVTLDKKWVQTQYGWISKDAFYDTF